jgi:hypothetical protein
MVAAFCFAVLHDLIPCGLTARVPMPFDTMDATACYYATKTKLAVLVFAAIEVIGAAVLWWLWEENQLFD